MTLVAGNDINLTTAVDYIKTEKTIKKENGFTGGSTNVDFVEMKANQSTELISRNGDIYLVSGNDINSVSSNIRTEGNSQSAGNINLLAGYKLSYMGEPVKNDSEQHRVNLLQSNNSSNASSRHEKWSGILGMLKKDTVKSSENTNTIEVVNNIQSAGVVVLGGDVTDQNSKIRIGDGTSTVSYN
jgi:hypothetical protein